MFFVIRKKGKILVDKAEIIDLFYKLTSLLILAATGLVLSSLNFFIWNYQIRITIAYPLNAIYVLSILIYFLMKNPFGLRIFYSIICAIFATVFVVWTVDGALNGNIIFCAQTFAAVSIVLIFVISLCSFSTSILTLSYIRNVVLTIIATLVLEGIWSVDSDDIGFVFVCLLLCWEMIFNLLCSYKLFCAPKVEESIVSKIEY
ncbi:hypothetical protein MHBO_003455 [Bonamia ostreae]|uniref:Uncharacterized protein n=1 Tax=Bonamia ostreae TaxID=126728 RepID=A0ABV2AQL5_9EUKA